MFLTCLLFGQIVGQKIDVATSIPESYCRFEGSPCHKWCQRFNGDDAALQDLVRIYIFYEDLEIAIKTFLSLTSNNPTKNYAREFHKNEYLPYGIDLNKASFRIATALVLAEVNCINEAIARVNEVN